jgi:N-carbamoyl-L-amino-acid hydrolase
MIGSGVYGGAFSLDEAHATLDKSGVSLGEELKRIGYLGEAPCAPKPIHASFEAHIEQGPILEAEDITVGVVRGVQGMRWFKAHLKGQPVHAGPTPMDMRKDPVRALGKLTTGIYEAAAKEGSDARATFGDIIVSPGATNTVPETVVLSIDLRHPDEAIVDRLEAAMREIARKVSIETDVDIEIEDVWRSPAVQFDETCISAVRDATAHLGIQKLEMVSGAGHDSVYLSRVAPTSMIFVPCKDGISHNEAEDADPKHLENGANVLLHAVLNIAL